MRMQIRNSAVFEEIRGKEFKELEETTIGLSILHLKGQCEVME